MNLPVNPNPTAVTIYAVADFASSYLPHSNAGTGRKAWCVQLEAWCITRLRLSFTRSPIVSHLRKARLW